MLGPCLLLLAGCYPWGKRQAASLRSPDLDVSVKICEHAEFLESLLFELELAVEADHRAEQEG